ncbi:MAG: sigma-70 family RNA polymerase sigma factor [Planctomycetota bacterium]
MDFLSQTLYREIRQIAAMRIRGDRAERSICATDLAHEVIERALRQEAVCGVSRDELLRRVSQIARQVLVDHGRRRGRQRRGGGRDVVQLAAEPCATEHMAPVDVVAIDDALLQLAALDARQAQMIEMRYFGGCSVGEVAGALGVSVSTVEKEERKARAWLELALADDA